LVWKLGFDSPAREWLARHAEAVIGVHNQLCQKTALKGTTLVVDNFETANTQFLVDSFPTKKPRFLRPIGGDMATVPITSSRKALSKSKDLISFEEAMEKLSRDDRFRATIYAMNTLLVQKGIYSPEEFEFQFRQFARKQLK
jgi:hypothetical protein